MNFSTLQGLTIPEGVVTQIAKDGVVLWEMQRATDEPPIVLQVEKQLVTTTVGETTYSDEECVLLDIYPKTNGTVKVTYGGVTKTVTDTSGAENPNAIQVAFGTFQGVSDGETVPASGTLTIEGAYNAFGCGVYGVSKRTLVCSCITDAQDLGNIKYIPASAFQECTKLSSITFPRGIQSIGGYAFYGCTSLTSVDLSARAITSIEPYTFYGCTNLSSVKLPDVITNIGSYAFYNNLLSRIDFPNSLVRLESHAFAKCNKLDYVHIPASVTFLGAYSLDCYENAQSFGEGDYYFHSKTPPEMGQEEGTNILGDTVIGGAFGPSAHNLYTDIHVPVGCGEAYKAADGWDMYDSRIVEEEGL